MHKYTEILYSRQGFLYRKEWLRISNKPTDSQPDNLPIRYQFFNDYESNANAGRYPHIFWQQTPLREKIRDYSSLEEMYSNAGDENCCICYSDGEDYKQDFAIFLDCNHLVCFSCAEQLFIEDNSSILCSLIDEPKPR